MKNKLVCGISLTALILCHQAYAGEKQNDSIEVKESLSIGSNLIDASKQDVDDKDIASEIKDLREILNEQRKIVELQQKHLADQQAVIDSLKTKVDNMSQIQTLASSELEQYRALGLDTKNSSTPVGDEKNLKKSKKDESKKSKKKKEISDKKKDIDPAKASKKTIKTASKTEAADVVGTERKPEEKTKPPEIPALNAKGASVLLPQGKAVLESSLEYSRSSAVRVAIEGFTIVPALNIGSFEITNVDRDTLTGALTGRIGLTDRIEFETRVPYIYRTDNTLSRPVGAGAGSDVLSEVTGNNLGDIEVTGRYQMNNGQSGWPFLIANLGFKTTTGTSPFDVPIDATTQLQKELPTGSGFYSVSPSVTAIFPSDPVVFYSNLGYIYNMPKDIGGTTGEIDPGDAINFSMGMGFSANERASFSLGYSHSTVMETTQNGASITNSDILQVGTLNLGFAYRMNERVNLNFNIGAGLTNDAPDVQLVFRVPVSFDVF